MVGGARLGYSLWGLRELDTTERLHFHFSLPCTGEENGNHSCILAWRIPGTGEPGGLLSMGSHRLGHDGSNLAAVAVEHSLALPFFVIGVKTDLFQSCGPC